MNNCKDLGIFMNEIIFLMTRINGNVRALNQIRQENNTQNLRDRVHMIEYSMLIAKMQMEAVYEELVVIRNALEQNEVIEL